MAPPRTALFLLIVINIILPSRAGPLGPMPNVTSSELGLKEGSCALGDVVYMPGDEFPGSTPCEKCMCAAGDVKCTREVCEPRPGCKALHRPDHCCPTYQCECEQEGRVYGNGEKLVDPVDPCRVCYCQGGEVVCRRIACFVRDDCTPRLVPGRCCPEYDNCPLRGVTSLSGVSSTPPSVSTSENDAPPVPPRENIKQKITIKEITPVSEIPVITEVKIKEILPSPSIEVAEYSSSKSPLIPREATSEKNDREFDLKTESPSVVEVNLSSPVLLPESTQHTNSENKDEDALPSKISFSTQDVSSFNPSNVPIVATMGIPAVTSESKLMATTKTSIIEEEDTFDHNPAFPPIPDDLSVLRNHEDEIVPEPVVDNEHVVIHDTVIPSASPAIDLEAKEPEPLITSTTKDLPDTTTATTKDTPRTTIEVINLQSEITISTEAPNFKESPMLNLRSAITTEIMNPPSMEQEDLNGNLDERTTVGDEIILPTITTTKAPKLVQDITDKQVTITEVTESSTEAHIGFQKTKATPEEINTKSEEFKVKSEVTTTTFEPIRTTTTEINTSEGLKISSEMNTPDPNLEVITTSVTELGIDTSTKVEEQTTSSIVKSNFATEITSQTEFSSLPVETSDQNPPEVSEQVTSDKVASSTVNPYVSSSKLPSTSSEVITVSRAASNENSGFENVETTEFILTSYGSSETATDAVELIKISASPEKSSAIIESNNSNKNNVFTDLISLVSDVASMSDHTSEPLTVQQPITANSIPNSEELIPVNAGYKSKNKKFNQNSITEIPPKSKNPNAVNKHKLIEIEDDESESVKDAPPPNDKIEPTTRRPIIDNVSDDNIIANKTAKKDIEIITQSYVPTISRRPTKVVMKKTNEKATDDLTTVPTSTETTSDSSVFNETPLTTSAESSASAEMSPAIEPSTPAESSALSVTFEPEIITEPKLHIEPDLNSTTERKDTTQ